MVLKCIYSKQRQKNSPPPLFGPDPSINVNWLGDTFVFVCDPAICYVFIYSPYPFIIPIPHSVRLLCMATYVTMYVLMYHCHSWCIIVINEENMLNKCMEWMIVFLLILPITKRSVRYHRTVSPNRVFGDIMVLTSPTPLHTRPPIDPDDVNVLNILQITFKFYRSLDTPYGVFLLKFDTLRALEQLRSQQNDTVSPKSHQFWTDCFQIFYRCEISEATVQITFIFIGQTRLVFGKCVCTCVTKHSNAFRNFSELA